MVIEPMHRSEGEQRDGTNCLGVSCFFSALSGALTAERLAVALEQDGSTADVDAKESAPAPTKTPPRSDALTLLSALQREARFVDLVQEPLKDYSDDQIGAAARDVLRDCRSVLDRMFDLQPVLDEPEQSQVETPAQFSSGRYRLTGAVQGEPPYAGLLVHPGWQAGHCEMPTWTGADDDRQIIAPAEIEVR